MQNKTELAKPDKARTNARFVLIGLFALFFLPVFGAIIIAVNAPHWTPFGSINHGELVQPAVADALRDMLPLDAGPMYEAGPSAPWIIAHVGPSSCDLMCEGTLVQMRQARLALGKDAHRVERWWLPKSRPQTRTVSAIMQAFPGLRIGLLAAHSPLAAVESPTIRVQTIDPAGFLILRYSADRQETEQSNELARALLKDFKRLLKNSKQRG